MLKIFNLSKISCYSNFQNNFLFDKPKPGDFSDILVQNFKHKHLIDGVSAALRQPYLKPYENATSESYGILFGPFARLMTCLPVMSLKIKQSKAVHFIVDTGSRTTYLEDASLKALFQVDDSKLIESMSVNIWGIKLIVGKSVDHFEGINLLGADFLRRAQIEFQLKYSDDPEQERFIMLKSIDHKSQ